MREAMHGSESGSVVAVRRESPRSLKRRTALRCSVCTGRIWFDPVHLMEPEDVTEQRLSWTLCKPCYRALLVEMRRSPIRTPLRLRIAMGMVASERWPQAYPTKIRTSLSDYKWFAFIAVGFVVAMIAHLALIVMVAGMK